jgi:protein-S-isoprenylcysteine O-methyltransferase Ste14
MLYLPYVLLALWFVQELAMPGGDRGETLHHDDRGSLWIFHFVGGGGYAAAFFFAHQLGAPPFTLGAWATAAGAAAFTVGIATRVWAIRSLGRYFTRRVQVSSDQPVIEDGPYRWVRHPSYTGFLLIGLGIGLSLRAAGSVAVIAAAWLVATLYRVHVEEAALAETLGAPYREYMTRTKRFLPFLV